jgi:SAM-dependent methyltransferase
MSEERRVDRGRRSAARSSERASSPRPFDDPNDIAVEEGEPENSAPATQPDPHAEKRMVGAEPGTGRRPRGRMTLRIPDDEVTRPSAPPPYQEPEPPPPPSAPTGPPIQAQRIITINPPPPSQPDGNGHAAVARDVGVAPLAVTVESSPDIVVDAEGFPDAPPPPMDTLQQLDVQPMSGRAPEAPWRDAVPPPAADSYRVARAAQPMRAVQATMLDVVEEVDVEAEVRRSEPGSEHEVSPEDVVSVESVPTRHLPTPAPPPPGSAPHLKAARPAQPPPAPRPPLVILPGPSPIAPPPMNEAAAAGRRRARPWWEELFNDDFIRTMAKISDSQIAREADFIEDSLGVAKGAMVLDLACGTGRHATELTRRGYQVVGFDLSLAMLARAADEAQDRSQKLNFVQGDMRDMTFEDTFDGVYAWNTSFGFFEEEKNAQVISNVRRALKPGGQFLLDVQNRDFLARQTPSLAWFEGDGCVCMDEMHIDWITSRMRVKRTMMMDDGRTKEIEYSIRVYSLHELGKLLHESGFRVAEVSGRVATPGVFLGGDSPQTLILAEKR